MDAVTFHEQLQKIDSCAEWEALGARLGAYAGALNWRLGDWMVIGDGKVMLWGDTYSIAADVTGLSLDRLSYLVSVAKAFPPASRLKGLSWTMHSLALRLPEDERIPALERALTERWKTAELVAHAREIKTRLVEQAANQEIPVTAELQRSLSSRARWRTRSAAEMAMAKSVRCPAVHDVTCPHCQEIFEFECGRLFQIRRKGVTDQPGPIELVSTALEPVGV